MIEKKSVGSGGPRKGSGPKPKLTKLQMCKLKERYIYLMYERAKERALRLKFPKDRVAGDFKELKENWLELHNIPVAERRSEEASIIQSIASGIIGKNHGLIVGSGRGPVLKSGPREKLAADILRQVADEANKALGRDDITPRLVRSACGQKCTDEELILSWMNKNIDD